ncbi:MAG: hypothetical protein KAS95_07965 [Candidatus Heimdallarchaeota archaeon]|nr:hypothetical protein [Candidatus Heimdallarchaeota archaeon]
MIRLSKAKKGQLFIIEAFIAVSVMIIMVTALYEVQLATQLTPTLNLEDEVFITIRALDNIGNLDKYLYSLETGITADIELYKQIIEQAIYGSLPDNGQFLLYCENVTVSEVIPESWINQYLTLPDSTTGIDYLVTEVNGKFTEYIFHFQFWIIGV